MLRNTLLLPQGATKRGDSAHNLDVWWTVYVLERQISVLLGVPLAISDNDISASLPNNLESVNKPMTVRIHVKLSQAFSQVVNALYRDTRELNSTLVKTAQEVLQRLAEAASELREHFPVPEQESLSGISRVSGYLNQFSIGQQLLAQDPLNYPNVLLRPDHPVHISLA
ncbi:fungal specific transcription factor domain-containing protein [Aspergillus undulatus]|uniref:fungal specific transcription factor domain-containing protein n=1 Tax=Aspergillus undulatus TaxID=1810928 RepID=UPI003CCCFE34